MSFVHFIAGMGKNDVVAVNIGVSKNPEFTLAEWKNQMPFPLKLLGMQQGTLEDAERLHKQFRTSLMHGSWYKATRPLLDYVASLEKLDPNSKTVRVSLDLNPEELAMVERLAAVTGHPSKVALIRKALRFYNQLVEHKERGYLIQAVKGGSLLQFPQLDVPYPLTIREAKATKKAPKK